MMRWEVDQIAGPKRKPNAYRDAVRWDNQRGYCVVGCQKVPVRQREMALGCYQALQQASLMEDAVWHKIMHGLTTRRYSAIVRELKDAYAIEKSTVSEHFIEASRGRLQKLRIRPLAGYQFGAVFLDGTCFDKQQVMVALGLTLQGEKLVLGLRQGGTENTTVVKQLLEDLHTRGLHFQVPRVYVLDGGKALHAAVRKMAGKCAVVQRCQVHKIRNVVETVCRNVKRWYGGD